MDRRASRVGRLFAHDPSDARDNGLAVGLRQEIDFDLHTLTDAIFAIHMEQDAADAEVDDLTGVPFRLGDAANSRRPFHAMSTGSPRFRMLHTHRQSKKHARELKNRDRLTHRAGTTNGRAIFVIAVFLKKTGKYFPNRYAAATCGTLTVVFASAAALTV